MSREAEKVDDNKNAAVGVFEHNCSIIESVTTRGVKKKKSLPHSSVKLCGSLISKMVTTTNQT